jgi:hypothetical protein
VAWQRVNRAGQLKSSTIILAGGDKSVHEPETLAADMRSRAGH